MRTNTPHYHCWFEAATGKAMFKLRRAFRTQQAAAAYAGRRQPDPEKRMVRRCYRWACRPPLD